MNRLRPPLRGTRTHTHTHTVAILDQAILAQAVERLRAHLGRATTPCLRPWLRRRAARRDTTWNCDEIPSPRAVRILILLKCLTYILPRPLSSEDTERGSVASCCRCAHDLFTYMFRRSWQPRRGRCSRP